MAEGLRYVHVGIEKSLQSRITLVITVAAIKWPYGISLPVCRIICVILRLAVLIQYRSVINTHTHTHTQRQTDRHTTTAYTALSIASRGKNRPYCMAHQVRGNERRSIENCYADQEMSVITTYLNDKAQTPLNRFVVYMLYSRLCNKLLPHI